MRIVEPALVQLRREGYEVLSLSGGEPLLYPELEQLTTTAQALGFRITAITNGFRVNPRFKRRLAGFDGMAVSFDGMREVHNRVRGNAQAFDKAVSALGYLAEIGLPSAAAYTVSRESLSDIPDFLELAASHAVRAVQLRPLVMAGRAPADYAEPALGPADLDRLWLIGEALAAGYAGELAVHTDLAHATAIAADRGAWSGLLDGEKQALSDLINPLVITPEGRVRPYTFDFPPVYDLCRIEDIAEARLAPLYRQLPRLRALVEAAFDDLGQRDAFIDWFAYCRDMGRRIPA